MSFITVGTENSSAIGVYYEDHGSGQPIILIHGYPLNGHSWEKQERALLEAGYRVITYDRRGFGRSTHTTTGYDYDTFAADLKALIDHLSLSDVILVGFSMGTGEVVRYLSRYGSDRVSKAVLLGALQPFLLKTGDNPQGVDAEVFKKIEEAILDDRFAYFKNFLDNFYNVDVFGGKRISKEAWQNSFNVAASSSAYATYACVQAWLTDFRPDLPRIDVPVLVMHGSADRILPISATSDRLPDLLGEVEYMVVDGGPHAINWTHAEEVNSALLGFLRG